MSLGSPASRRRGSLRHRTRTTNTVWLPITAAVGVLLLLLWYAASRDPGPADSTAAHPAAAGPNSSQDRGAAAATSPTPTVPPPPQSGCVTGRTLPAGISTRTLRVAGVERSYVLAVPAGATGARALPLILTFHDLNQSTDDLEAYTGLADQATKAGFVLAAPIGAQARWNFPRSAAVGPDDVLFTGLLLNELTGRMCLDAHRTFATGYGDGANMVLTDLCGLSDRFAAAVTVGASVLPVSCARPTTSLLEIHGTVDTIAPIDGGGPPRSAPFAAAVARSASDRLARYASALGCSGATQTSHDTAAWSRTTWPGCPSGRGVALLAMTGAGHTWPGAQARPSLGPTADAFKATSIVLIYFGYTPASGSGGEGGATGSSVPPLRPGSPSPGTAPTAPAASSKPSPSVSATPPADAGSAGTTEPGATPAETATPSPTASNG
ncbi:plasmid partitioning protein [Frankia sp. AgB32]|uniref:plasmid partitioning protein n=1 Tax=Frankia sp. AgB32 TaxID=631119 RepID=UPI00200F13DD|nr:plasmid partitioning protein [Frankia sp. AgB32]MCK9897761.1 plasmid partitioning protein [Frankia sp. AgB32]